MIVDKILEYLSKNEKITDDRTLKTVGTLAEFCFQRQFMEDRESDNKGKIYPSGLGKCVRQLAYGYHGIEKEGKEIDSRGRLTFWTGDLAEITILQLAKLAGCVITGTGLDQLRITFKHLDKEFSGYADGLLFADGEQYLVECKSMSSYGFDKFQKGEIDPNYRTQVNVYMEALGIHRCVFVAINKDNAVLHEEIIKLDPDIIAKARLTIRKVIESTPEKLPDAPSDFDCDAKGFYPWQCLYCAWWKKCRTNAELVLVKNSYKLKEKKGE